MGQHPPSYESDPYPTSAQGAAPTPSPYGIEPARPGTPPHGGAPPHAPAPVVFVIPPPTPRRRACGPPAGWDWGRRSPGWSPSCSRASPC